MGEAGRREVGWETVVAGIARVLLAEAVRRVREGGAELRRRDRVAAALASLESGGAVVAPGLDAACRRIAVSRRYFTRTVRALTGRSWLEHVRAARIRHACALLRAGRGGVAGVAFECGFDDLSTFHRAFLRETGLSPLRWVRREGPVG